MLCCAQPCQCVLSQLVADPHSRSIAPNRSKSTKVRVALTTGFWPHKSAAAPNASVFNGVYICEIELSPQSCARFADLMFQSAPASSFFYISKCKSSSQQFCALFANNFPRDLYFGDPRSHITRKTCRVLRPRVVSPVNLRASERLHFPTTW